MSPETVYVIALVVGVSLFVLARLTARREIRRARLPGEEPRIGRLALAIFLLPFGGAGLIVGFAGLVNMQH